jgi:AhpD family alkylhydroperoxidase
MTMADPQMAPVPRDQLPDDLKQMFDTGVERTGDATVIGVMGHHPDLARWYFGEFYQNLFYNGHGWTRSDVRTKELLRLKLSKQHGCQFCNRSNSVDAMNAGITQAQIDAIFDADNAVWSDKDRAILALGDEMMLQNMEGQLSAGLLERLRQHYDDAQIVELGLVAAVLTGVAKWIFTFDMVDREETCPIRPPVAAAA